MWRRGQPTWDAAVGRAWRQKERASLRHNRPSVVCRRRGVAVVESMESKSHRSSRKIRPGQDPNSKFTGRAAIHPRPRSGVRLVRQRQQRDRKTWLRMSLCCTTTGDTSSKQRRQCCAGTFSRKHATRSDSAALSCTVSSISPLKCSTLIQRNGKNTVDLALPVRLANLAAGAKLEIYKITASEGSPCPSVPHLVLGDIC